ncbi:short-chain dehydrogenase TIC 32 B, chloroplastic [Andrographis paniculata]|uniref:short-chain dehydrogenase TIC 32 B, chloroplastic n=1 Tax=Andrographis paniculata TaxID=175694 RepID=UPI0021E701EC|nr:short-chain dehydrogenase TIC 32 B, chloroplastic [Andrographis paniculata]
METTAETAKYLIGWRGPSGFSSRTTAEEVTDRYRAPSTTTAIVTGATSGIGFETARVLAKRGARLVLPARDILAARHAKSRIAAESPGAQIVAMNLDLASFRSIRQFVADFNALALPLNLLINNAGKYSKEHILSEDGIETTLATNYFGHFLLTKLLLEKMVETARDCGVEGRIVNLTSNFHKWFSGDPISYIGLLTKDKSKYDATRAYALSKLATILHTKELALKLEEMKAKVTVNCVNPGIAKTRLTRDNEGLATDMVFFLGSKLFKTIHQAAATTCYVATDPRLGGISGKYFSDCNEASTSALASDLSEAVRLWALSESVISADSFRLEPPQHLGFLPLQFFFRMKRLGLPLIWCQRLHFSYLVMEGWQLHLCGLPFLPLCFDDPLPLEINHVQTLVGSSAPQAIASLPQVVGSSHPQAVGSSLPQTDGFSPPQAIGSSAPQDVASLPQVVASSFLQAVGSSLILSAPALRSEALDVLQQFRSFFQSVQINAM